MYALVIGMDTRLLSFLQVPVWVFESTLIIMFDQRLEFDSQALDKILNKGTGFITKPTNSNQNWPE